jgi:hypothetical protein
MATRSRVSRSKSPKRAASPKRSRSRSKKSVKKASKSPKRKMVRKMRKASKSPMRKASKSPMRKMKRSKSASRRSVKKIRSVRRVNAYANFRKTNWKKVQAAMPGATFAQISKAVGEMWKAATPATKSKVRKMIRSPRKVRKMRMSKKRAMKKSGSPRKARKDKGKKRMGAMSAYQKFVKAHFAAKRAALGGNAQPKMVMKALGADWRNGIRHY